MAISATVSILTCLALIGLVIYKPSLSIREESINIYWLPPVLGALVLACCGVIGWQEIGQGLTAPTAMNPIKILILFFSMTLLSVFLDTVGFFRWLAEKILSKAKGNQTALFLTLYFTVSLLTVFTSNDIIVLTFTPFICYFTRQAKIDPLPYLFGEFIAANTWSMLLIIGNPTNIYLATGANCSFIGYLKIMALPTLLGSLGSLAALWLLFRKKLKAPMQTEFTPSAQPDQPLVALGLIHLGLCIFLLVLSNQLALPMWLIAFSAMVSLFLWAGLYLKIKGRTLITLRETFKRTPFEMAPFVLSMFILVLAMEKTGLTQSMAAMLNRGDPVFTYGISSFLAANLINNIPMSVLYSGITANLTETLQAAGLYGAVIGSNLGAFFTPIGALAGIMWTGMLRAHQIPFSFGTFIRYGAIIAIP